MPKIEIIYKHKKLDNVDIDETIIYNKTLIYKLYKTR